MRFRNSRDYFGWVTPCAEPDAAKPRHWQGFSRGRPADLRQVTRLTTVAGFFSVANSAVAICSNVTTANLRRPPFDFARSKLSASKP